jgi:hypothetical protein
LALVDVSKSSHCFSEVNAMAQYSRRDPGKEALWRERLAEQAASGCSIAAWCRNRGLDDTLFHYWKRTLARRDACAGGADGQAPARRDAGSGGAPPQTSVRFQTPAGSQTPARPRTRAGVETPTVADDPALFARVVLASGAPAPAPLAGLAESRAAGGCLELIVAGGHIVRIPAGFDAPTLWRVLELLEARPC